MSDVNIRIGGDNSDYKRALVDSEQASRSFNQRVSADAEEGARKTGLAILKRLDIRMGITAIAAAAGFSFQAIADAGARMWLGFSKAQQEALELAVALTEKGAKAQEAALEKLKAKKEKEAQDEIDRTNSTLDIIRDARLKAMEYEAKARQELAKKESEQGFAEDLAWVKEQDRIAAEKKLKLEGIAAVKAAELAASEEVARVEKARIDEKFKSLIDQWTGFEAFISSKGRGDRELSDRELERKIANIQQELSAAQGFGLGTYQGAAGTGSSDFLTAQQRGAAAQARQELDFRQQVRQAAGTQGEDAAFRQFTGLSEQRFREILQTAPGTQDVILELKKLNSRFDAAIPTVLVADNT